MKPEEFEKVIAAVKATTRLVEQAISRQVQMQSASTAVKAKIEHWAADFDEGERKRWPRW